MAEATKRVTDIGPPHHEKLMPPIIKENYGTWKYHEVLKPGVMVHVGETGDKLFTVRAAGARLMSIYNQAVLRWTHAERRYSL